MKGFGPAMISSHSSTGSTAIVLYDNALFVSIVYKPAYRVYGGSHNMVIGRGEFLC
jgi:hypothetical protein